jgi:hypothetical protein
MMPPTMTMPPIITAFGSPFDELTNWARTDDPCRAALVVELHARDELPALHRGGEIAPGLVPPAARVRRDHHLEARLRGRVTARAAELASATPSLSAGMAPPRQR